MGIRGKQRRDTGQLHLSHDRKVSPGAWYQAGYKGRNNGRTYKGRWVPEVPNSFGLPAGTSCPGQTEWCARRCYALSAENYSPQVRQAMHHNMSLLIACTTADQIAELLIEMLGRYWKEAQRLEARDRIFRIHWDGDFYSVMYAEGWRIAMAAYPDIAFWTYTRSFGEPINVIPILSDCTNLALYLSIDEGNVEVAYSVLEQYPTIMAAWCADGYDAASQLANRRAFKCPENSGKMPLVSDTGRGACTDCRWCPDRKVDIMFASDKRDQSFEQNSLFILGIKVGSCENPACGKPLYRQPGRDFGHRVRFCSHECRWEHYLSSREEMLNDVGRN